MIRTMAKSKPAKRGATLAGSTSRNPMVAEHLAASKRVMKSVLSSKAKSVRFLVEAGILDKSGKGLAKPYR